MSDKSDDFEETLMKVGIGIVGIGVIFTVGLLVVGEINSALLNNGTVQGLMEVEGNVNLSNGVVEYNSMDDNMKVINVDAQDTHTRNAATMFLATASVTTNATLQVSGDTHINGRLFVNGEEMSKPHKQEVGIFSDADILSIK